MSALNSYDSSKSLSSPMQIIHNYLLENSYSYDDRRRAMSLFNAHHEIAHEFVNEILSHKADKNSMSHYLNRIFHS